MCDGATVGSCMLRKCVVCISMNKDVWTVTGPSGKSVDLTYIHLHLHSITYNSIRVLYKTLIMSFIYDLSITRCSIMHQQLSTVTFFLSNSPRCRSGSHDEYQRITTVVNQSCPCTTPWHLALAMSLKKLKVFTLFKE